MEWKGQDENNKVTYELKNGKGLVKEYSINCDLLCEY